MRSDPGDAGAKAWGVRHHAIGKPPKSGIAHWLWGACWAPASWLGTRSPIHVAGWPARVWVAGEASDLE